MSHTEKLIELSQNGDLDAREQLILENSGLIWSIVRRFMGRGTEADDLYQLGCLGFLKAVDGFDLEYGTQFSTYAVPKISGEIRRYLRDDGAVKVSRSLKERAAAIKTARNQLINSLGREPTIGELSSLLCMSPEDISEAEAATAYVGSMQEETGSDGFTLESILSDTHSEDNLLEQIALRQAIDRLPERETAVIRLRYFHGLTQQKTSVILKVSQVQVSRIEKKAIMMLREFMK